MAKLWTPRRLLQIGRTVVDRMEPIDPFPADERPDRKLDAAWRPVVKRRAFCALGDGAISPVVSGIKYFRDEFLALCQDNKAQVELAGAH